MDKIEQLLLQAEEKLRPSFAALDEIETVNTKRVLDAFRDAGVAVRHFAPSTGYGYDDIGRDTLAAIFANLFGTERWPLCRRQSGDGQ